MKILFQVVLVGSLLAANWGCSSVAVEEDKTNSILHPYLAEVGYRMSRDELTIYVVDDLKRNEDWRRAHATMFSSTEGDPGSVKYEQAGGGSEPLELRGGHEIYVLEKKRNVADETYAVQILSAKNHKRLYDRELKFLERVHTEEGQALIKKILEEHPGIKLEPWAG